jgi:superfamily II DNA or RNA helicase
MPTDQHAPFRARAGAAAGAGLRGWQREALPVAEDPERGDVLINATPGAGKTLFALTVARRAFDRREVNRVIIVAPTDHLRTQWADAAARFGLFLDPTLRNSQEGIRQGTHGYVTTYAQVASAPLVHATRTRQGRTLVILDEIHHAADGQTWGDGLRMAFDGAPRRLSLSGTPFRTGAAEIPYITYDTDTDGSRVSRADYTYSYAQALADGVVRPVMFAAYTGQARWRNTAGQVVAASLSEGSQRAEAEAWAAVLDPKGQWVRHVIAAVDQRITDLRRAGIRDAAGLILASDQAAARAYAAIATDITGHRPVVAVSDDKDSSRKIDRFRDGTDRLIVAVRQVSEGVDIPRACALGWLTSYRTPLFFAQAVGRVIRARSRRESATVFLPAVRPLLALAAEMEAERNHVIVPPPVRDFDGLTDAGDLVRSESDVGQDREFMESEAAFAHLLAGGRAIVADGAEPTAVHDDPDTFGLFTPDLLSPAQTAALLAARDKTIRENAVRGRGSRGGGDAADDQAAQAPWRLGADLRKSIHVQVSRIARDTGRPHAQIHGEVRRAVPGPATAAADPELLQRRLEWLTRR